MTAPLPPALRDALVAPDVTDDWSSASGQVRRVTYADRARAMAAALRWALTCREFWPEINAAIAALEQEARDA